MRALVVGGGFLGSHVADHLAATGDEVVLYSRSFNSWLPISKAYENGSLQRAQGALPQGAGLRELIDKADVVYYLAGTSTPAGAQADPGQSIVSSVVPATAMLDLMATTSTKRIVVASSGGTVYGRPKQLPTPEDYPNEPVTLHGQNALTVERYAVFYAAQKQLEPVILRYSNPYGPGQQVRRGQGVVAAWCQAWSEGKPLVVYGSLSTTRDFVYIDDAAEATVMAGRSAPAGIYNLGSGRSSSLHDVLEGLRAAAKAELWVEKRGSRDVDVDVTWLDSSRLSDSTGWEPRTSLETGLAETLGWFQQRAVTGTKIE